MTLIQEITSHGLFAPFCGAIGFIFGHWFHIGRDKRKEFNHVAEPVYLGLRRQRDEMSPYSKGPSEDEIRAFVRQLSPSNRLAFERAQKEYHKAWENQKMDEIGFVKFLDPESIRSTCDRLLAFTKRK